MLRRGNKHIHLRCQGVEELSGWEKPRESAGKCELRALFPSEISDAN